MASLNAGPEYYAAEGRYSNAKTYEEKMAALEEMLRHCPKHKGSQGILSEIRDKMVRLRKERNREEVRKKASRASATKEFIRKQGGAQIALLGFVNSGKTALFNALTGKHCASTHSPFETAVPEPGMMEYEHTQVQIIDTPSFTDATHGRLFAIARNAELAIVVLSPENAEEERTFFESMKNVYLKERRVLFLERERDYDVRNAASANELKKRIYGALDVIRVFTKAPRAKPDYTKPVVLPQGGVVADVAERIHKEFAKGLKYARVWGSTKFAGQQVGTDYKLKDGDVVELHLK
ncbi:TPA: TGS domain-containing protein [Candidatus Micrarchaeota archaeon]|nr:TGS domain-containing protein [Candidatus Micrarchaeota archaeon]